MSFDIYPALSGANAAWAQLETISNNMANSSTTGFKAAEIAFQTAGSGGEHGQAYVVPTELSANLQDGAIVTDGDPTHLALQGQGYFVVETNNGSMLSRSGAFTLNNEGQLVTSNGHPVLNTQSGNISIPPGESIQITGSGELIASKSGSMGHIKVVTGHAVPIDQNLWAATGDVVDATDFSITQGALEGSNVDPMAMMVDLIEASRHFEAFQKAMQASDELDQRANKIGS